MYPEAFYWIVSRIILMTAHEHPHFTDKETEHREAKKLAQGHAARWNQNTHSTFLPQTLDRYLMTFKNGLERVSEGPTLSALPARLSRWPCPLFPLLGSLSLLGAATCGGRFQLRRVCRLLHARLIPAPPHSLGGNPGPSAWSARPFAIGACLGSSPSLSPAPTLTLTHNRAFHAIIPSGGYHPPTGPGFSSLQQSCPWVLCLLLLSCLDKAAWAFMPTRGHLLREASCAQPD